MLQNVKLVGGGGGGGRTVLHHASAGGRRRSCLPGWVGYDLIPIKGPFWEGFCLGTETLYIRIEYTYRTILDI